VKNSENVSANTSGESFSRIQSKLEKMKNYHAVEVNGREITKLKRIDREYKMYEDRTLKSGK